MLYKTHAEPIMLYIEPMVIDPALDLPAGCCHHISYVKYPACRKNPVLLLFQRSGLPNRVWKWDFPAKSPFIAGW